MTGCASCKTGTTESTAVQEWIVVNSEGGRIVDWVCSWPCLARYAMQKSKRWIPTPEEEERMHQ